MPQWHCPAAQHVRRQLVTTGWQPASDCRCGCTSSSTTKPPTHLMCSEKAASERVLLATTPTLLCGPCNTQHACSAGRLDAGGRLTQLGIAITCLTTETGHLAIYTRCECDHLSKQSVKARGTTLRQLPYDARSTHRQRSMWRRLAGDPDTFCLDCSETPERCASDAHAMLW